MNESSSPQQQQSDNRDSESPQPIPPQAFPALASLENRQYSEAHYRFLASLIDSQSARQFFTQIAATDFSHQCILAFHKLLTSGFDKNAILAYNKNIDIRKIDFQILMNLMVTECHETDVQNPAFLTFQENIYSTFCDFVSRSQNARERDQLLRSEFDIRQTSPSGQQQTSRFGV